MKVNVLFERAKDGYYSCFMEEELPDFGLAGYGDTAEAAKADFLKSYEEMCIRDSSYDPGSPGRADNTCYHPEPL